MNTFYMLYLGEYPISPTLSEEMQEVLFDLGYGWGSARKTSYEDLVAKQVTTVVVNDGYKRLTHSTRGFRRFSDGQRPVDYRPGDEVVYINVEEIWDTLNT
jgi:hypothetical protein